MKSNNHFIYTFLLLFSSCIIVKTPGFYSGYKKLSPEQKQNIVFLNEHNNKMLCAVDDATKIYAVTAQQLLGCLKDHHSSIVYFWSPNCHSKRCISLGAAEKYCRENNYKLYIVSEYYDMEQLQLQNNTLPVFSTAVLTF
jgi:hypothetical protein